MLYCFTESPNDRMSGHTRYNRNGSSTLTSNSCVFYFSPFLQAVLLQVLLSIYYRVS